MPDRVSIPWKTKDERTPLDLLREPLKERVSIPWDTAGQPTTIPQQGIQRPLEISSPVAPPSAPAGEDISGLGDVEWLKSLGIGGVNALRIFAMIPAVVTQMTAIVPTMTGAQKREATRAGEDISLKLDNIIQRNIPPSIREKEKPLPPAKTWSELLQPRRIIEGAIENLPLTAALAYAYKKNPALGYALMFAAEGGEALRGMTEWEKRTGEMIPQDLKTGLTLTVGAVNAQLERIGISSILDSMGGKALVRKFVGALFSMTTEGATEFLQEWSQIFAEHGYQGKIEDLTDLVGIFTGVENWIRSSESGVIGAAMGGAASVGVSFLPEERKGPPIAPTDLDTRTILKETVPEMPEDQIEGSAMLIEEFAKAHNTTARGVIERFQREGIVLDEDLLLLSPENPITDISPAEWAKALTSIQRGFRKTNEEKALSNIHPATFPSALPEQFIKVLTHEGDLVADPFAGTGSTLAAASRTGRRGIGVDISSEYKGLFEGRTDVNKEADVKQVVGDAREFSKHTGKETVDLIVTSPPYWNILTQPQKGRRGMRAKEVTDYGVNDIRSLAHVHDYRAWLKEMKVVAGEMFSASKDGGFAVLNVAPIRVSTDYFDMPSDMSRVMQLAGYTLIGKQVWDKSMTVPARALGYRWRSKAGEVGGIRPTVDNVHEDLLIFQKKESKPVLYQVEKLLPREVPKYGKKYWNTEGIREEEIVYDPGDYVEVGAGSVLSLGYQPRVVGVISYEKVLSEIKRKGRPEQAALADLMLRFGVGDKALWLDSTYPRTAQLKKETRGAFGYYLSDLGEVHMNVLAFEHYRSGTRAEEMYNTILHEMLHHLTRYSYRTYTAAAVDVDTYDMVKDTPDYKFGAMISDIAIELQNGISNKGFARTLMGSPVEAITYALTNWSAQKDFSTVMTPSQIGEVSTVLDQFRDALAEKLVGATDVPMNRNLLIKIINQTGLYLGHALEQQRAAIDETGVPLFQKNAEVKGAVEFAENGKAIIKMTQYSDFTTIVHEIAHIGRRMLDEADQLTASDEFTGGIGLWTVEAEEAFARGFERFIQSGKAANPRLQSIYSKIKQWFREIYGRIKGSPIDIKFSAEMEAVYNRMITPEERITNLTNAMNTIAPPPIDPDVEDRSDKISKIATIRRYFGSPQFATREARLPNYVSKRYIAGDLRLRQIMHELSVKMEGIKKLAKKLGITDEELKGVIYDAYRYSPDSEKGAKIFKDVNPDAITVAQFFIEEFNSIKSRYIDTLMQVYKNELPKQTYDSFLQALNLADPLATEVFDTLKEIITNNYTKAELFAITDKRVQKKWKKSSRRYKSYMKNPEARERQVEKTVTGLARSLKSTVRKYLEIPQWGLEDYVTKIEEGNYQVQDEDGNRYAFGRTEKEAKLAMAEVLATRGDLEGELSVKINRSARINPTKARKDILRGGKLLDTFMKYAYAMNKRIIMDPIISEHEKLMKDRPKEFTELDMQVLNDQKNAVLGIRKGALDSVLDDLSYAYGLEPGKLKGVALATTKATARLKLGWRMVAPVMNAMSGFGNTWAWVGRKYFLKGMDALDSGKWEGVDVEKMLEEAEHLGYMGISFSIESGGQISLKESPAQFLSLWFFQKPEPYIRRHGFVTNYIWLREANPELGHEQAMFEAAAGVWLQNFSYNIAAIPRILRTPGGKVIGQFKNYFIKSAELFISMNAQQRARMLALQMIMSGPRGLVFMMKSIPILMGLGLLDDVEKYLTEKKGGVKAILFRGVGGLLGVDVSAPATFQFPSRFEEWLGPSISEVKKLAEKGLMPLLQHIAGSLTQQQKGTYPDWDYVASGFREWVVGIAPIGYYFSQFLDSVMYWETIKEFKKDGLEAAYRKALEDFQKPNVWIMDSRGNKAYPIGRVEDKIMLLLGMPPAEKTYYSTLKRIWRRDAMMIAENRSYISGQVIREYLKKGKKPPVELMNDLALYGVRMATLKKLMETTYLTPELRELLRTEMIRKPEAIDFWLLGD